MNALTRRFHAVRYSTFPSLALLLLRLIMGIAFILHGWGKIQQPFNWMPADGPMAVPGIFQFLAALSEFGGGIALIVGLLTPLAALGMAFTMAVAVHLHMNVRGDAFVGGGGGGSYELPLVYLGLSILFIAFGPGKFSLDALLFKDRH